MPAPSTKKRRILRKVNSLHPSRLGRQPRQLYRPDWAVASRSPGLPGLPARANISSVAPDLPRLTRAFHEIGRDFHARGWVLGTSGNFSAVVSRSPLRIAVTGSG